MTRHRVPALPLREPDEKKSTRQSLKAPELGITLTVFQLLLLFQVKTLENLSGSQESAVTSHALALSITHHISGTGCSESDWMERAQARALERLGLLGTSHENTRWRLTEEGAMTVRMYQEILEKYMPGK